MAVSHALQSNFSRGAVTPQVAARQDKDWYIAALAEAFNFLISKYGILRRRSGTRFCGSTKFADSNVDFKPFLFSSTQAYFLEFGHLYIRVWTTQGEQVLDGGGDPIEITTLYDADDVDRIQCTQYGDVIFLSHPDYPPRQLRRLSHASWQISNVDFVDGPYLPINDTAVTCDPSANPTVGGSQTLTFSSASAINGGAGFTADDVGRLVRVLCTTWCWFEITAVTNTTTVTVTAKNAGATHVATTSWRLGAFAKSQGYPGSVEFFKGRLCWARTAQRPRAIWLSMAGLPYKYEPSLENGTVNDDHAFMVETLSGLSDEVLWLKEASDLQIGTASSIRTLGANDNGDVFGPRAYDEDLAIVGGSTIAEPVLAGSSTVHAGRFGLALNDLYYDFQSNGLVAPDISVLSEHLMDDGVRKIVYQQAPSGVIYTLLNNGTWVGTTYERYERVIGFSAHATREGDTVESLCVAPDYANKRDALIMVTRRTVNEVAVQYVELLEPEFLRKPLHEAWFADCAVRYEGTPVNVVTGLDHLIGELVTVFADGSVYPNQTVTQDGEIKLPGTRKASKILVGLPLTATARLLRSSTEARDGSMLGRELKKPYVYADLLETSGVEIAPVATGKFETLKYRSPSDPMDSSPSLYTGTLKRTLEDTWDQSASEGSLDIRCALPLPATIRAINVGVETH